jgi:aminoglycoside 3-N-acetyltransferase
VGGLLDEGCTVMVPTFTFAYEALPPPTPAMRPARNAFDYENPPAWAPPGRPYEPGSSEVDRSMGAIPRAVVAMPGRARGAHPLDAFTAVGPLARELVAGQTPEDVYAPLRALAELKTGLGSSELLGPAPLLRLRGRHRAQLIGKTDEPRRLAARAARLLSAAAPAMRRADLRAVVDVDPQSV